MEKEIGKVTHFFDKISVAVVKLSGALKAGDKVHFVSGSVDFEDSVSSMQVDKEPVKQGKKGDEVAIKVAQPVREGVKVFLVS